MRDNDRKPAGGPPSSGIRLSRFNTLTIIIALIVSAVLIYTTRQTIESFHGVQAMTERYTACQQNAMLFKDASDYLTGECRTFAMTGDMVHAERYVAEIEITRRREQAISGIDDLLVEPASQGYLAQGLEISDALADRECYAMRLAAEAEGLQASLPARIGEIALSAEDAARSDEDKRAVAIDMLFGDEYQQSKALIHDCVEKSITALIEDSRGQQLAAAARLNRMLLRQQALIVLMLVLLFAVVLITFKLIIRPLQRGVFNIRAHQEIPAAGCSEMRFLARTYNEMYAQNQRSTERLTYSATHDALTGVYNRAAFDDERRRIDPSKAGVLFIDVDWFKAFNDSYGHDVGDRVLARVARVLSDSFRSEDFVCRIGGDEFCVIMRNANSRLRGLVEDKIARANARLQAPQDGLPAVSLSVGVAFGDRENPTDDIFKDADAALYAVKRGGRGGCAFYDGRPIDPGAEEVGHR